MQISVRLLGHIKQYAPEGETSFTMAFDTGSTVDDVLQVLEIPLSIDKTVLLNGRRVSGEHPMEDGAQLVIFPIMEGG